LNESLVGISLANPAARLTFAAALALATGACNSSEPCEVESVQVRMPSTLVRSGQSVATELFSEAFVGLASTRAAAAAAVSADHCSASGKRWVTAR
jgi:hypothetical protein